MNRAAILTIGDELLAGRSVDTNSAYLAARLTDAGFRVLAIGTVGDDPVAIIAALQRVARDVDILILTGGLGPTRDDLTVEALAAAAGVPLVEDGALRERIARRTQGRAPEQNARMARIPEGAVVFDNPVGAAPGLRVVVGGTAAYALPGIPAEMRAVFEASVLPDLPPARPRPRRVLRLFGPKEAEVAARLGELARRGAEPAVGLTVRDGVISITVTGRGAEERANAIRDRLGGDVFGEGDQTLASVALDALRRRGWTLAAAESLTGGLLAATIVDVPRASAVFRGGVVAYATELKDALLGVEVGAGAVSEPVARQMAEGVRERCGADVGLATTGVAGPGSDERGNPVGLVFVAVADVAGTDVRRLELAGGRELIRRRSVHAALDLLRRRLGAP